MTLRSLHWCKTSHHWKNNSEKEAPDVQQNRKSRATPKAPRNPEASLKPTPLRIVDHEIPQAHAPIVFVTPEDELRAIYLTKTATEMSADLLNRIRESCELRGVLMMRYVKELRSHVPNTWKNPGGFLTDFARKIRSKMSGFPSTQELGVVPFTIKESPRCSQCPGIGRQGEQYCKCQLGHDLERVERRPAASMTASLEPVHGEDGSAVVEG